MKNEERIERLRKCASFETCNPEMCDLYSEDDCRSILLKDAADALEAISKTVIPHRNYEHCHIYWCECGWFLRNKDQTPNYCPNCGKRIEWESAE